jgi:predicted nucleic acid-binding protein
MISLDTNIILAAFDPADRLHMQAHAVLGRIGSEPRVVCPVVYAELAASREWDRLKLFLERAAVDVLWEMPEAVWERAGMAMGEYARMRRGGALPRRVVADFLIGAHAEHHGLVLATFDRAVYEAVFSSVRLIS